MIDQFFCKTFYLSLCALSFLFLMSLFSYFIGGAEIFLLIIALIMIFFTAYNPVFGLLGVFLELFSSPHGQLISTEILFLLVFLLVILFI